MNRRSFIKSIGAFGALFSISPNIALSNPDIGYVGSSLNYNLLSKYMNEIYIPKLVENIYQESQLLKMIDSYNNIGERIEANTWLLNKK